MSFVTFCCAISRINVSDELKIDYMFVLKILILPRQATVCYSFMIGRFWKSLRLPMAWLRNVRTSRLERL